MEGIPSDSQQRTEDNILQFILIIEAASTFSNVGNLVITIILIPKPHTDSITKKQTLEQYSIGYRCRNYQQNTCIPNARMHQSNYLPWSGWLYSIKGGMVQ